MTSRKHILIVEDEQHLGVGIKYNLEAEGYRVTLVNDGPTALKILQGDHCIDLMILDLMLPGMSGYAVCETLRDAGYDMPILILSARSLSEDRTRGFDVGANQYLTKPFDLDELLSRVKNLLRLSPRGRSTPPREPRENMNELKFGDAYVNFQTFEARVGDEPVRLTQKELQLLRYFADNESRVISRHELLAEVWDMPGDVQTRSVDQFVSRLRKAFEKDPSNPKHFLTFRDAGYRFVSEPAN
jgi:two-component system alkaline phosphatase synthesis response regulator PhoP